MHCFHSKTGHRLIRCMLLLLLLLLCLSHVVYLLHAVCS